MPVSPTGALMKLPRITQPYVRKAGLLQPASWETALDTAASLISQSVAKHGPNTFGMFSCSKATNEVNYIAQKFIRGAVGSNNIDSCNRT
jgi:predicted molibdopterin-dependent oxidoreductase YjgC